MIAIVAFIILWVRMSRSTKLTIVELPRATEADLQQIREASKTAFFIMLGFTLVSFIPFVALPPEGTQAQAYAAVIAIVGLFIAAMFDLKSERIKKRCRAESEAAQAAASGGIRWFHIVFAVLMPYIGLPWGIVNLIRKRRRSGLALVLISAFMLLFFGVILPLLITSHTK
jgi:TRAP-type C4-dicarboxylate transport system permease large subunit